MSAARKRGQAPEAEWECIYGRHSVQAVVAARPDSVRRVVILKGKRDDILEEYLELTAGLGVEPEIFQWNDFLYATGLTASDKHQGICLFTAPREFLTEDDLPKLRGKRVVVALDQLSDPRNLAAVLRSAAFFGIDGVVVMKYRSSELTPQVSKIAVGGAEFVDLYRVTNLANALRILKKAGFLIYGLDERGEQTLAQTDFAKSSVLVVGAEGQGLREKTRGCCDALVRIPGGRAGVDSLNAGVAASIAIAELCRHENGEPGAAPAAGD